MSKTVALRDAAGRLQGFIQEGSSGKTFVNLKGHHTGYIDSQGRTRDVGYNLLSNESRPDLVTPAPRKC